MNIPKYDGPDDPERQYRDGYSYGAGNEVSFVNYAHLKDRGDPAEYIRGLSDGIEARRDEDRQRQPSADPGAPKWGW